MSHKISYRERGEGHPLILLHGYGGTVHHWEDCATELAKHYRVVVPNLSHLFLSTDRIFFTVQIETLAEFIKSHFPNQKVHLAGTSYGGALAWGLASRHPELVDRTILINPMVVDPVNSFALPELRYFFAVPLSTRAIYMLLSTPIGKSFLRRAAAIFRDERSGGIGRLDALKGRKLLFVSHLIYNFSWILRKEDWNWWGQQLSSKALSGLIIFDREDLMFKRDVYFKFAHLTRCAKVIELTGAGHLAIKSRPESISKAIHEYITEAKSKAA